MSIRQGETRRGSGLNRDDRWARVGDLADIAKFDIFAGDRRAEIAARRCRVSVRAGRVLGYVSWLPFGFVGNTLITYLCVAPECRREGIGSRLLESALSEIGAPKVFVSTEETNTGMQALLNAAGWRAAGGVDQANDDGTPELFYVLRKDAGAGG